MKIKKVVVDGDGKIVATDGADEPMEHHGNLTAANMAAVLNILPEKMNLMDLCVLTVNVLATYDFLPKYKRFLLTVAQACAAFEEEVPGAFTEGGMKKYVEGLVKEEMKKFN